MERNLRVGPAGDKQTDRCAQRSARAETGRLQQQRTVADHGTDRNSDLPAISVEEDGYFSFTSEADRSKEIHAVDAEVAVGMNPSQVQKGRKVHATRIVDQAGADHGRLRFRSEKATTIQDGRRRSHSLIASGDACIT